MTRSTNARIAGFTFLLYIAAGIVSMNLSAAFTRGESVMARLANIAVHAGQMRWIVLLGFVQCFCALVLAITLYSITRDEDHDLALLAATCRVTEGVIGVLSIYSMLALQWLATARGADAPDPAAAQTLGAYLLRPDMEVPATFFAVGSLLFSWLLLRGRMIPVLLAWLGVTASVIAVVAMPLKIMDMLPKSLEWPVWVPMLLFEIGVASWFLIKGVRTPRARTAQTVA